MIEDIKDFPGIPKNIGTKKVIENEKVIVVYGEIFENNFLINVVFLISKKAPTGSHFLLREISYQNEIIWKYVDEKNEKDNLSRLIFIEEFNRYFVVVIRDNFLLRLTPVTEMVKKIPVFKDMVKKIPVFKDGEIIFFGKIKANLSAKIKKTIARELNLAPIYSIEENKYWAKLKKLKEKKEDLKIAEERKGKETKAREKIIKKTEINSRRQIDVVFNDNKKYYGIPVTDEEWMLLSHDSFAILVESYDRETNTFTNPLEAFRIEKSISGKCSKKFLKTNEEKKESIDIPIPVFEILEEIDFEINDDIISIAIIEKKDLAVAKNFLGDGEYLGIIASENKYQVLKKEKDEFLTIGELEPIDL